MLHLSSYLAALTLALATLPAGAQTRAAHCPNIDEQLTELLASAKQRVGHDGQMRVEFEVDARGKAHLLSIEGSRNYRTPVRMAMDGLDCQAGQPQRYLLNIRFEEPLPAQARAPQAPASQALALAPR